MKSTLIAFLCMLLSFSAYSSTIPGYDITINDGLVYDGNVSKSYHNFWKNPEEDQEIEPGAYATERSLQKWDLEGMRISNQRLTMIGGFNFIEGEQTRNGLQTSGDIFISLTNDPFHTDYVLDVDWQNRTYNVVKVDENTTYQETSTVSSSKVGFHRYLAGGTVIERGQFSFFDNLSDSQVGYLGGIHYAVGGFDLSFLDEYIDYYVRFTLSCGNDLLLGDSSLEPPIKVDSPNPFILIVIGLLLLAIWLFTTRNKK